MRTCPSCGEELPDKFRICGFCGTPLPDAPPPVVVRKTVTVVFSDLAASTALGERLDSESLRAVMDRYFAAMREALEGHGGTLEKFIGDAVMAVFGLPVLHEDDALRAVRAANAMVGELERLNGELEERFGVRLTNRTGVNTGEVVAGDPSAGQRLVTGDAVNVAARLEQACPPNGVLIGPLTYRLVRNAVDVEAMEPLPLKGKSEPVPAFKLVRLRDAAGRAERAPFVGREAEIAGLQDALREVVACGSCRQRVVLGPAGVGKSRLLDEFGALAAPDALVLRGRCLPYGRGVTFWPVTELVKSAGGFDEADSREQAHARLAALVGSDDGEGIHRRVASAIGISIEAFPLEELFWGIRKLLERLAAERPVVAIFEDLHWAERSLLALLDHVTESADAPILLVGSAREEVLDLEPGLGSGPRAATLTVPALSADETDRVIEGLGGEQPLPPAVRERIIVAADGNPLFAEQLLSMLVDEGHLRREPEGWVVTQDLDERAVPPTIQALLDARLDQLAPEDRSVLEPASVVGLEFEVGAVRALAAEPVAQKVELRLEALVGKHLVQPVLAEPVDEALFRFQHVLIRDSAYGRLLKRVRAELHERFVAWAERAYALRNRGDELDEIFGYHLEQAHRYMRELAPLDAHGRELGDRAAARLASAGWRAFAREDMHAAANLLRRAVALLPQGDPRRVPLLLSLAEALLDTGEFAVAEAQLEEAIEIAEAGGDQGARASASLQRLLVRGQAGGRVDWGARLVEEAASAIPALEASGDEARLASAWRALAWARGTAAHYGLTAHAADRAIVHATRAGDDRQRRRASAQYAIAALYGPTPAPEAIARCETILESARDDRRTEGLVSSLLARLVAMRGDLERARALYRRGQEILAEAGRSVVAASTSLDSCSVEILAGDLPAAEAELRRDYEQLEAMGETYLRSTVAGELARVLVAQERDEEAWRFSDAAEALAAEDDVTSQALWRLGRARLLARAGDPERAVALAEEAIERLRPTDARVTQADALMDLAIVLDTVGRPEEAERAAEQALELHVGKGNLQGAGTARALATAARGRAEERAQRM